MSMLRMTLGVNFRPHNASMGKRVAAEAMVKAQKNQLLMSNASENKRGRRRR